MSSCPIRFHGLSGRWLGALVLLTIQMTARAEWLMTRESDLQADTPTLAALAVSETGQRLYIYRDDEDRVHATLLLKDRLTPIHAENCGTLQVDGYKPVSLHRPDLGCRTSALRIDFSLGKITNDHIVSPPLVQFLYGRVASFRYQLAYGGYRQADFSLKGSNASISSVLGDGVDVRAR